MRWHRASEGYLQIDHRAGFGTPQVPGGTNFESATATCKHCTIPITLDPRRTKPKEYCPQCDGYICSVCSTAKKQPGYIHMSYAEHADQVANEAYALIQRNKG
jgi:hypothetical protein